jgi:hypothetical protein
MPVEIVSGYLFVFGLVHAAPTGKLRILAAWLVFAVSLIVTPIFLLKVYHPKPEMRPQVWIASIAFPLWAYALGGPFDAPSGQILCSLVWRGLGRTLLLAGWAFL